MPTECLAQHLAWTEASAEKNSGGGGDGLVLSLLLLIQALKGACHFPWLFCGYNVSEILSD